MQLLTFGSRELGPNDYLHVNWKLASSAHGAPHTLSFSGITSQKIQFQTAGGILLWLTIIDLQHQSYFFYFKTQSEQKQHGLPTLKACVGLHTEVKIGFPSSASMMNQCENPI